MAEMSVERNRRNGRDECCASARGPGDTGQPCCPPSDAHNWAGGIRTAARGDAPQDHGVAASCSRRPSVPKSLEPCARHAKAHPALDPKRQGASPSLHEAEDAPRRREREWQRGSTRRSGSEGASVPPGRADRTGHGWMACHGLAWHDMAQHGILGLPYGCGAVSGGADMLLAFGADVTAFLPRSRTAHARAVRERALPGQSKATYIFPCPCAAIPHAAFLGS